MSDNETAALLARLQNPPFGTETSGRLLMEAAGDDTAARLKDEVEFMKVCGVIELMVRNPNIDSFVKEKEAQLAAALARVEALEEALRALDGEVRAYGFREDGGMRRMIAAALKGGAA